MNRTRRPAALVFLVASAAAEGPGAAVHAFAAARPAPWPARRATAKRVRRADTTSRARGFRY